MFQGYKEHKHDMKGALVKRIYALSFQPESSLLTICAPVFFKRKPSIRAQTNCDSVERPKTDDTRFVYLRIDLYSLAVARNSQSFKTDRPFLLNPMNVSVHYFADRSTLTISQWIVAVRRSCYAE
jgi:hypothetical protein